MMNATDLLQENALLRAQLQEKSHYIQQLEDALRQLRHRQFGASSEKLNADQLGLFNEAEEQVESPASDDESATEEVVNVQGHQRRVQRIRIPADIPRDTIVHDLPDDEKVCPHDGTPLKEIGSEQHEQLDLIPAQLKAIVHLRKKYACPCCEQYVVTATKPKQPIEKSIASPGLLAHIAVSKYADALPLYRLCEIFKRIGIELDRTTLANWMIRCGELVQPLINLISEHVQRQTVVHLDETTVQVLNEPGKTPQSQSYMWVMACYGEQPAILFHYAATRSGSVPELLLGALDQQQRPALMVDGYEGYQRICNEQNLVRLGCWAHARRKFIEAQKLQPKGKTGKADQVLAYIQQLYAIEREVRDKPADECYRIRQQQARPVIDKLKTWLEKTLQHTPPKTALGKAVHYLHEQWERLVRYLDDGHYPIDNNPIENSIRPFAIGRKNWMFANSQAGAKASANLYSLVQTAKSNGLNPYDYLRLIFKELPNAQTLEDIERLLPWQCNATNAQA